MRRLLALAALAALAAVTPLARAETLDDATFVKWRESLAPGKGELAWTVIPWRASFWDAVVAAQREQKPVLLWAMNGHPLACT